MPRPLSLSAWVAVGSLAGIVAGLVFGQRASVLIPIGSAYAMMLQIAIYPYLICSLLLGLGRLSPDMSRRFLGATWPAHLLVWVLTFGTIWLLAHAIPLPPSPASIVPRPVSEQVGLLTVLIPANIAEAWSRNYVPAIVVFAVVYGLGIQAAERKQTFFDVLETIRKASVVIWAWTVKFAPLGVFALFAGTAGTIEPAQLGGLLIYIGLYTIGCMVIGFIILPAILTSVAPTTYRELLTELQPGLVLTLATTLPVMSVPSVERLAQRIAERAGCPQTDETANVIKTALSLGYVFAQLGNNFVYLFIFYAAYGASVAFSLGQQLLLPVLTLLSAVGTPSSTIGSIVFIGKWLHLPSTILNTYVETWTVTRYPQVLLSVIGFCFVTCAIPLIYFGKTTPLKVARCAGAGAVAVLLIAVTIAGGIWFRPTLFPSPSETVLRYTLAPALTKDLQVTIHPADSKGSVTTRAVSSLKSISTSGVLRVGYNPHVIPFCYFNINRELVGFDVSYAYQLAHSLNVNLELIPYEWESLASDLQTGKFDLAISGIYITPQRLQTVGVSRAYYESPIALIVKSDRANLFLKGESIAAMQDLKLAAFEGPALLPLVHQLFPKASVKIVPNYDSLPELGDKVDAAVWTLEQASAWAEAHPGYTAVQPSGLGAPIPFAFLFPPGVSDFREYVDQWLALKGTDGFRSAQIDYWIDGKPRVVAKPRWNLWDAISAQIKKTTANGSAAAQSK
jgi:Na+/H+-dicarboxylate symporter/ABC-type amino acid transport substrate-binding protein